MVANSGTKPGLYRYRHIRENLHPIILKKCSLELAGMNAKSYFLGPAIPALAYDYGMKDA
jgi:hypothetical protein